jgi:hypothetical protein
VPTVTIQRQTECLVPTTIGNGAPVCDLCLTLARVSVLLSTKNLYIAVVSCFKSSSV